jgi:hypothetical protein
MIRKSWLVSPQSLLCKVSTYYTLEQKKFMNFTCIYANLVPVRFMYFFSFF